MRRGEIWWARLDPPRSPRPVLLLTRDDAYLVRTHVTVAPLTRSARRIPSHVAVGPDDAIRRPSVINLDDMQTIPIADLDRRVTVLSREKMAQVDSAIAFALALD